MMTLLMFVIFLAYIGLGIPDSLFGTAWPGIYVELNVPVSAASWVTLIISLCTMFSSLVSAKVIAKIGAGKVVAVSTALTALGLMGFAAAPAIGWMCLLAIPLGLGGGMVDTALNSFVALHYQASHVNFLHCCYGIGVTISPYLMSIALKQGPWRQGYWWAFLVQAGITAVTVLALPLWKKVSRAANQPEDEGGDPVPMRVLARKPMLRVSWAVFFCSCGLEYTCGSWASTYLVQAKGLTADVAAIGGMLYYLGMAMGRLASGVLAGRITPWRIIRMGQGVAMATLLMLLFPLPGWACMAALMLVGLGNGPVFPNLIHMTPALFGREIATAVMGTQMTLSYAGILLMPVVFGYLTHLLGVSALPGYAAVLAAGMLLGTTWLGIMRKRSAPADD